MKMNATPDNLFPILQNSMAQIGLIVEELDEVDE